jgi:hypothetical protein
VTTQRKPQFDPAVLPNPTNYNVQAVLAGSREYGAAVTLTCTVCSEVLTNNLSPQDLVNLQGVYERTTKHNQRHHPGLLWIFTSAGWMRADALIPDPVKSINDAIDKSAREQKLYPH